MATGSDFGYSAKGRGERSLREIRGRDAPRGEERKQTIEGGTVDADDDVFGEVNKGHLRGSREGIRDAGHRRHQHYSSRSSGFQETDRRSSWREGPREKNSASRRSQEWTYRNDIRRVSSEPVPQQRYYGDRGYSHRASTFTSSSRSRERDTLGSADDATWRRTKSSVDRRLEENKNLEDNKHSQSSYEDNTSDVRQPGDATPSFKLEVGDDSKGVEILVPNDEAEDGSCGDSKSWRRTSQGERNETVRQGGSHDAKGFGRLTRDFFRRPGILRQAASARVVDSTKGSEQASDQAHGEPGQEKNDSDSEVTDSTEAVDTLTKAGRAEFQFHPRPEGAFQASLPTLVPPRRQLTKRTARVPALSEQDLRNLLAKTPSDVLLELAKRKDQFLSLLDGDDLADETLLLTVRVVSRLTYLDQKVRYSKELNTVFSMIESSLFTSKHLTRYIVSSPTNQPAEYHDNPSSMQGLSADFSTMLKFLQLILEYKPSSCPEVSVALILLQKQVTSASLNNKGFNLEGCLMTEVEQVSEICSTLSESQRMAKKRSFEKPPPDNFRDIPIFPKSTELRETGQPFLRKNIIRGKYDNVEHYLDVQFRLLREDFVAPLREGVTAFLSNSTRRPQDIRIYYNVTIDGTAIVRHQLVHKLSFELRRTGRPEHWESSKRLLFGSLVCLTTDDFEHIYCATIADRNVDDLTEGLVNVHFLTPPSPSNQGPFIMAESSAYFEAYRHVLLGLQEIKEGDFPFKKYIVDTSFKVDPPLYLRDGDVYNMSSLVVGSDESFNYDLKPNTFVKSSYVPILEPESWPLAEDLHLDESQKAALQTALTKEFAIIQGPPGTGKTYIGLKIVELLLYNSPRNYNHAEDENVSPILVVCYTNHALDQFLEGIIAFGEENVVRVGGRSSSEILKKKNISELRRNIHDKGEYKERMNRLRNLESMLKNFEKKIQSLILKQRLPKRAILNLMALSDFIKPTHYEELQPADKKVQDTEASENSEESMKRSSGNLLKWLNVDLSVEEKEGTVYEEGIKANEPSDRIDIDVEGDAIQRERQDDDMVDDMVDWEVPQTKIETIFIENAANDRKSTLDSSSVEELQKKEIMTDQEADKVKSIWFLEPRDRWRLYRSWVKTFKEVLETNLLEQREKYQEFSDEIAGLRSHENLKVLRESSVVGMTTTGAAKHRSLLQLLGPRVVVVEEAAEVLEAHIITTLTSKCQHLILIGDHQQLKPNPTVYRLAKMFNLDTSLFERMINNSIKCQSLTNQHRMRPEVSLLMRKHFYSRIEDDESVLGRDDIRGVTRNVFFITHEKLEDAVDDNKTRSNQYEAEVLVALCRYLLQQGYKPSQITILTTYTGQLFCLRRLMDKTTFEGVRVCVVDNFQGEENDIILLSLVRSNAEGSIGFLRTSNRVCVALSRAKLGLYCIGNATILKKAQIWQDIIGTLEAENQTGASLPLVCQNHPATITQVVTAKDFEQKAPCGGCDITCENWLPCGHACRLFCHPVDPEHKEYKCKEPCERLCKRKHPCSLKCYKPCKPCDVEVSKVMPKCGHEIKIPCYKFDKITCPEPCQTQFEECHHGCPKECGQPCPKTCPGKCERTLPCDHACTKPCGSPCTRYCTVQIEKRWAVCGHTLVTYCSRGNISCPKECEKMLQCGHLCAAKCGEPCTTYCRKVVKKTLPTCGHEITVACSVHVDSIDTVVNETRLSRIHRRKFNTCKEIVEKTNPYCGHVIKLPCHQDVELVPCPHVCEKLLTCGHRCPGKCSDQCPKGKSGDGLFRSTRSTFCRERCNRLLACGHPCPKECGQPCPDEIDESDEFETASDESDENDPCNSEKCTVLVEKTFLKCGHLQLVKCWETNSSLSCRRPCRKELSCGHVCTLTCGEACVCRSQVLRSLPKCRHAIWLPCYQDVESYRCQETCMRVLDCGHKCSFKCWEPCLVESSDQTSRSRIANRYMYTTTRKCVKLVTKTFADCDLSIQLRYYKDTKTVICSEKCGRILACGHPCPNKCGESCPGTVIDMLLSFSDKCSIMCTEMVQKDLGCGHRQFVECWQPESNISCKRECRVTLECGHRCRGTCSSCKNGTRHIVCEEICKRQLLCGHSCVKTCSALCPSECRKCKHGPTSKYLSWARRPDSYSCKHNIWNPQLKSHACILPCRQNLPCGHPCVGVCGEPCPRFCRVCGVDERQMKHICIRSKDTFIYLVDCGHFVVTRFMDTMMSKIQATLESGCIEIRSVLCPKCKEPIIHCPRYQDLLKMIEWTVDVARRKCEEASVRSKNVGFGGHLYALKPDQETSENFSFAVGNWIRCPHQGHVFYVEENKKKRQELSCPDCATSKDDSLIEDNSSIEDLES